MRSSSGRVSLPVSVNGGWYIIEPGRDEDRSVLVVGGVDEAGGSLTGEEESCGEEGAAVGSGCVFS